MSSSSKTTAAAPRHRATSAEKMPSRGFNPRSLKRAAEKQKTPRWKLVLLSLLGIAAAGCTDVQTVYIPAPTGPVMYIVDPQAPKDGRLTNDMTNAWPVSAERLPKVALDLQRCTDHAASGLKNAQGDGFNMLRFDADSFLDQPFNRNIGSQRIASVQNGTGEWYGGLPGRLEYRKVAFHCLQDDNGQVLYSFVRPQ